jgi:hypothetical protein
MSNEFERRIDMSHNQDLTHEPTVENLGPLYGNNGEFKDAYTGGIAVETQRDREALEQLSYLNFDHLIEQTVAGAPEDCGDERPATTFTESAMKILGPQNMGGTSTNALVYELTTAKGGNHLSAIRNLNSAYVQNGVDYRPGGHTAEGAHNPNCGCAAIDLIRKVNEVIIDPNKRSGLIDLSARMMGHEFFDEDLFQINRRRYERLYDSLDEYLPPGYQETSLDLMRKLTPDIAPINTRVGEHKGLAVLANHVAGTRLNQDVLYATPNDLRRPFEAFGVDVWYAFDLGEKLFPHESQAGREFVTGRIMYDAASLLALTDGSLALLEHRRR